jgi:ligand-binding SRPBCC domain-containing protein
MPRIEVITRIAAPPQRCFDLARNVDVHVRSASGTGEKATAGRTSGLLGLGDEVTWQARHFGVLLTLTSRISAFDPPHHFRDTMIRGPLRRLDHDHYFMPEGSAATLMRDVFNYAGPGLIVGRLAEILLLTRHFRNFLKVRNRELKVLAETGEWRQYLSDTSSE